MSKSLEYATLEPASKWRNLPPPPGFSKSSSSTRTSSKTSTAPPPEAYNSIKETRALDFATAPAKSLPMQAFMLYIMGIVFMLLLSPFKNLAGMNDAFAQFAPSTAKNPKAFTTLLVQKLCRSMGLLPLGTGDWLAFETRGVCRLAQHAYIFVFRPR
ncbi:endoplasmic reticulum protein, partial [Mycena alexandri]